MDELKPDDEQNKEQDAVTEVLNTSSMAFMGGSDEQEYLRATWEKLVVGHDGLLSLADLNKVCEAIGIEEESIQVIKQLFERLDVDGDGRITYAEFMQIFRGTNQSQVFDNSFNQETFDSPNTPVTPMTSSGVFTEIGTLRSLDPDDSGFIQVSRLLEIWNGLGIQVGERFLKDVGLPCLPRQRIHMCDLSTTLEDELRKQEDTKQCGFLLLLHETRDLRNCLETCREERNKYRLDLFEANHRISQLAQDVDEHSTQVESASKQQISNLERQYKEQLKELHEALSTEEELSRDKVTSDIKQTQNRNAALKDEQNRLKQQIALQDSDIRKLVAENVDITDKLKEAQKQVDFMEKQISELRVMERKMAEYEQNSPREDAYQSLLMKVDQLSSQNQLLRDKNDELLSKMDTFSCKMFCPDKNETSLEGSVTEDYLDSTTSASSAFSLKRRSRLSGGRERDSKIMKKSSDFYEKHLNIHYVDVGACDESFDTSLTLQSEKLALRNIGCSNPSPVSVSPRSGRQCGCSSIMGADLPKADELSGGTDTVFESVLPMCATPHKTKCYNCNHLIEKLENFGDLLSDMNLREGAMAIGDATENKTDETISENKDGMGGINITFVIYDLQDRLEVAVSCFNALLEKYKKEKSQHEELISLCDAMADKIKKRRVAITGFMTEPLTAEGITTILEEDEVSPDPSEMLVGFDLLEEEFCLYEEKFSRERDTLEKQKAVVEENNLAMKKEIEILKSDLGGVDDYWQMKVKEEQDYYEEERKLYDEKFIELEKKIKEYEILLKIDSSHLGQTDNSDDSDRLSTIDENVYWEKQITELEEELKLLQRHNELLTKEKEHLKLSYDKERKNNISKFEDEMQTLKLETENLRAKVRSTDAKCVEVKEVKCNERKERQKKKTEPGVPCDLNNQLVQARKRNQKLEHYLKMVQKSTSEILTKTQQRHQSEMEAQQTMLDSTQQLLTSCLAKYKDQSVKLSRTDTLLKNLCLENTQLMVAVQVTEKRQKDVESILRKSEISQICRLADEL